MRRLLIPWCLMLSVILILDACRCNRGHGIDEGRIRPVAYGEGDTLELDPYPDDLSEWLAFYQRRLPGFRNGNFRSSGVVLHLDSLVYATSNAMGSGRRDLAWNPDSSFFIDINGNRGGDIDQEVILTRSDPLFNWLLMFNGPGVSVETADWLGKDVFILSRTTVDEKKGIWVPELYLFSLKDSTFTNFVWTRGVPVDSVQGAGDEFLDTLMAKKANKNRP